MFVCAPRGCLTLYYFGTLPPPPWVLQQKSLVSWTELTFFARLSLKTKRILSWRFDIRLCSKANWHPHNICFNSAFLHPHKLQLTSDWIFHLLSLIGCGRVFWIELTINESILGLMPYSLSFHLIGQGR